MSRTCSKFGLVPVISINRFSADTDAEIALVKSACAKLGVEAVMADHWAEGGKGAADVARAVVKVVEGGKSNMKLLYPDDMPLLEKIRTIAKEIYRATDISAAKPVRDQLASFEAMGFGKVPVCIAKTQYSFSTNPDAKGAPGDHIVDGARGPAVGRRGVRRRGVRRHHDHARPAQACRPPTASTSAPTARSSGCFSLGSRSGKTEETPMNVTTKMKPAAAVRPDLDAELNNLAMSKEAQPLFDAVKKHIEENVAPITEEFFRLGEGRKERWSWAPGQLELLEGAKDKAKATGLWNFFLPDAEIGRGPDQPRLRLHRRRARQEPAGVGVAQLLGARHRQHGGARAGRHARAEGAVAEAAAQRRDPLGLRHDRAGRRLVGRQEHRHAAPSSTATSG